MALKTADQLPLTTEVDVYGATWVSYTTETGINWHLFRVDNSLSTLSLASSSAILERMVAAYNATLVDHPHNTDACDPDSHVLFKSVCCGALLYRCDLTGEHRDLDADLPSKPLIYHGESACTECDGALAQF